MKCSIKQHLLASTGIVIALMLLSANASAGHVKIVDKPLVNTASSDVLPNIMFVLDNSGSMGYNYTPDWATTSTPWLFSNAAYNTQFYNPAITYTPAVKYDGVSMGNQASPWTAVENDVTDTGAVKGGTVSLVGNADYYAYIPGEYCTTPALTNCIASAVATTTYKYPAPIRWCNNSAAAITGTQPVSPNECRSIREGTYTNLRAPSATATITFSGTNSTSITSIKIGGKEILSTSTNSSTSSTTVATNVVTNINACTNAVTGNCTAIGYTASRSGSIVTIVSAWGDVDVPVSATVTKTGTMTATVTAFATRIPGKLAYVDIVSTNISYPLPGQVTKGAERTDCTGTCTYDQEMTNYANWYTYYRTRMQAMKTAASIAFKGIDSRYRVGFITISNQSNNYLPIAKFESGSSGQKSKWYKQLYTTTPSGGTPLRSALSVVGRIYAGKKPVGTADPVEYACQQNYTLLTTDGYWNTDAATDVKDIKGNAIGNLDKSSPRPLYEGPTATSGSLADTAKYYYDTDIRNKVNFDNCGNGTTGSDVCGTENDHPKQNMVTLTLGLGIDGTLLYSDEYKEQSSGSYADIKSGSANWSDPMPTENGTRIDDLWHAAVNAGGTYYSAKNPKSLRDSLIKGLAEINSIFGAGSAAAASNLQPVTGDNFQYVASYRTTKWTGNLEAREVDVNTLKTSQKATWCAENVAGGTCTSPAVLKEITSGSTKTFYCETPTSNATSCGELGGQLGVGGTGDSCYVVVPTTCTGTMSSLVSQSSDSRKIYINKAGVLTPFSESALSADAQLAFVNGYNALSQYSDFSTTQQSNSNKVANLVSYLRGQTQYDNRSSNPVADNKLFRPRETVLGDITQSTPAYLKQPSAEYVDLGYSAFKDAMANRQATVFVGANDGMLHAFDAKTGVELWAFIPTPVIKNLPKLADRDYAFKHVNFVNGNPTLANICVSGCDTASAAWRTILVGGLNGGGRGYYALDVTDPSAPILLWEFIAKSDNTNANLGYSFGEPVITKLSTGVDAGKWVVIVTSGYNNGTLDNDGVTNNSPTGNGQGYLYVLNAYSGTPIKTIGTASGSSTKPSGLGKITSFVKSTFTNNYAKYVYGGDLEGGLWRFDLDEGKVVKIATLTDGSNPQPITTAPELSEINNKRVVFVGTGKYLEEKDLTDPQVQTAYAIKDDNITAEIGAIRSFLVAQTIEPAGDFRAVKADPVDFNSGYGWRVDFPAGERVNVDPLLINGVLLMPTTVPSSTSCLGGGYGWFNYFNYKTGGSAGLAGNIVSEKLNTPAVGFNVLYDKNKKPVVSVVESNDPTPHQLKNKDVAANSSDSNRSTVLKLNEDGTYGRRSIWRELVR